MIKAPNLRPRARQAFRRLSTSAPNCSEDVVFFRQSGEPNVTLKKKGVIEFFFIQPQLLRKELNPKSQNIPFLGIQGIFSQLKLVSFLIYKKRWEKTLPGDALTLDCILQGTDLDVERTLNVHVGPLSNKTIAQNLQKTNTFISYILKYFLKLTHVQYNVKIVYCSVHVKTHIYVQYKI